MVAASLAATSLEVVVASWVVVIATLAVELSLVITQLEGSIKVEVLELSHFKEHPLLVLFSLHPLLEAPNNLSIRKFLQLSLFHVKVYEQF